MTLNFSLDFRKLASNWTGHLVNNNRPWTERILFEFACQYILINPQLNCFELNGVFFGPKTIQFEVLLYYQINQSHKKHQKYLHNHI